MADIIDIQQLGQLASQQGLKIYGIVNNPDLSSEIKYLTDWQVQKYSADMQYMQRDTELFTKVSGFLPNLKSIVSFCIDYAAWPVAVNCPDGYGRIARYAWGQDYHSVISKAVNNLANQLRASGIRFNYRNFSDAVPLLERALAKQAGLGFVGKNTMLIRPGIGSFTFLAELLLDVEIGGVASVVPNPSKGKCGTCVNCLTACPTQAFVNPYVLDASRCISYLTIEKRSEFSLWEQEAIGNWLFGCDVCQEVCPFNYSTLKRKPKTLQAFEPLPFIKDGLIDLRILLNMRSQKQFKDRFGSSAIMRTKRYGILRNALAIIANQNAVHLLPDLFDFLIAEDSLELKKCCLTTLFRIAKTCDNQKRTQIKQVMTTFIADPDVMLANYCKELYYDIN